MQDLIKVFFCFTMLCLATFINLPLLAYNFHSHGFELYHYPLQFITCYALTLVFTKNYMSYAVALYLLLGFCGLPIFAHGGGWTYIFEPSFIYLLALLALSIFIFKFKQYSVAFAPYILFAVHIVCLLYLLVTAKLNLTNLFSLSLYPLTYDLIFAYILVIIFLHEHDNKQASY